jgi:general secretion pathway protein G
MCANPHNRAGQWPARAGVVELPNTLAEENVRRGFTLVEIVVVILVLGILAGVAAPRFFDLSAEAKDNAVRQSLAAVRNAIDLYAAKNSKLPGADGSQATFKSDLAPLVRRFPALAAGPPAALDDEVVMDDKLSPVKGDSNPTEGWRYFYNTGVFIVNNKAAMASDPAVEYDDL